MVVDQKIKNVRFIGFKNRDTIPDFYIMADVIVLPSARETWGIVVNEAMCFSLPVIVSDAVGAGPDMVREGENGYTYRCGDIKELSEQLKCISAATGAESVTMRNSSLNIITEWSARDLSTTLIDALVSTKTK